MFGDKQPPLSGGRPSDRLRTLRRCESHGPAPAKLTARQFSLHLVSAREPQELRIGKTKTGFHERPTCPPIPVIRQRDQNSHCLRQLVHSFQGLDILPWGGERGKEKVRLAISLMSFRYSEPTAAGIRHAIKSVNARGRYLERASSSVGGTEQRTGWRSRRSKQRGQVDWMTHHFVF